MVTEIYYALQNGKLVSIEDVESGLACNCFCPACNGKLVARKGEIRKPHFAHYKVEDCKHGAETALHLAAKEIIMEKKVFTIPSSKADKKVDGSQPILRGRKRIEFDKVESEVNLGDFIADILAKVNGKDLIIEIAVTHFVDETKREKIIAKGISAVEVDLSELKDGFTKSELVNLVIENTKNKLWIFDAEKDALLKKKEEEEKKKVEERIKKWEEQIKKEKERIKKREKTVRKSDLLMEKVIKTINKKVYEAQKIKFDIILRKHGEKIHCPMKMKKYLEYIKIDNGIISDLRTGKMWNGNVYELYNNVKYVFIESEKRIISSRMMEDKLHDKESQSSKTILEHLLEIKKESGIEPKECKKCQYFGKFIGVSSDSCHDIFSCGYRKENNLK